MGNCHSVKLTLKLKLTLKVESKIYIKSHQLEDIFIFNFRISFTLQKITLCGNMKQLQWH